jgi:hypothetical protein
VSPTRKAATITFALIDAQMMATSLNRSAGIFNMKSWRMTHVFLALCLFPVAACSSPTDFTGFWKGNCSDAFGVQIKRQPGNLFSVSFCGPGGCFGPGEWMPNTPIIGDPKYRVINATTLEIEHGQGWDRYTRCTMDTNPVLDYATMPEPSRSQIGSGIVFFEPNRGLPDYAHKSPFTPKSISETLRRQLAEATASPAQCKVGEVKVPELGQTPLFSNLCDKAQSDALRKLIAQLAPSLTFETTAVWKAALTPNGEAEPVVTHVDISTDKYFHYPYLSIWRLELKNGQLNAQFGGSFLSGQIHAIRPFGHENNANKIFVKHLSCLECEPWVYLSILDFSQQTARLLKFTYDSDHKDYDETIEYKLPGMGHSVDANVETRIPKGDAVSVPDLMQVFRYTEEEKVEWWLFSCQRGQCDYQLFNGILPEKYRRSWESADKL